MHNLQRSVLLASIGLLLAGCAAPADDTDGSAGDPSGSSMSDGSQPMSSPTGAVSLYVHDAPTDEFTEIWIEFNNATAHGSDGLGWATIFDDPDGIGIDLLAASGGLEGFLGETELPVGNYTQIRLNATAAYGLNETGERTNFTMSNGSLKIIRPFNVTGDGETRISVDIDLDRSLREQGNGVWRMTPVLGTTVVSQVDDEDSGSDVDEPGDIGPAPAS